MSTPIALTVAAGLVASLVSSLAANLPANLSAGLAGSVLAVALAPVAPPPGSLAGLVKLQAIAKGLDQPIGLEVAAADPARRLFVVEKTGRIRIIKGGKVLPRPFMDMRGKVSLGMEQGLLGLAFHPQFARNGRFFLNYTDSRGDTHLVEHRVSADPDRADDAPVREWLFLDQPFRNHNGGDMEFGPDGAMWVGTGDGGSANDPLGNAQNPASLFGKMLRYDVDGGGSPQMVMIGLRNPWRYTFDRKTRDLYIADVGQNRYEEVNVLAAGQTDGVNLGWPIMEGLHCNKGERCDTAGLVLPALEYTHSDGCSITGGYVYRGKALPELAGQYFYADYCTGMLRSFRWSGGAVTESYDWRKALDPAKELAQVASFGQDHEGELYVISQQGTVLRLDRSR